MADYVNLKLTNGSDIVGVLEYDNDDIVTINNPIEIMLDPREGMYAKSYLIFSEENTVVFYRSDIIHFAKANKKAADYYEAFVRRVAEQTEAYAYEDDYDDEQVKEVEDMFNTLLESKSSIKH